MKSVVEHLVDWKTIEVAAVPPMGQFLKDAEPDLAPSCFQHVGRQQNTGFDGLICGDGIGIDRRQLPGPGKMGIRKHLYILRLCPIREYCRLGPLAGLYQAGRQLALGIRPERLDAAREIPVLSVQLVDEPVGSLYCLAALSRKSYNEGAAGKYAVLITLGNGVFSLLGRDALLHLIERILIAGFDTECDLPQAGFLTEIKPVISEHYFIEVVASGFGIPGERTIITQ